MNDYTAGMLTGIAIGVLGLAFTFVAHPSHAYKEKIVCEHYLGGHNTDVGCVKYDRVIKVEVH